MTEYIKQISRLKTLLIVDTIVRLIYYYLFFFKDFRNSNIQESSSFITQNANLFFSLFHHGVLLIFLYFIWKKHPVENKIKTEKTIMIFILGFIGIWLWLPNEREIGHLFKEKLIKT